MSERVVITGTGAVCGLGRDTDEMLEAIVAGRSAIKPIAVRMVYECHHAVKIPIVGMGGIATAEDALEFIIAGAAAVQIGTTNFVDPFIWRRVLDGISQYLERHRVARVADLVGTMQHPDKEPVWTAS